MTHRVHGGRGLRGCRRAGPVESARQRENHVGRGPGKIVHRVIVGIEGPRILVHGARGRQQPGRYLDREPVGIDGSRRGVPGTVVDRSGAGGAIIKANESKSFAIKDGI